MKHSFGRESGAAAVEMAFITPFLVLLVLGLVEFGWLFSQNVDIKHGAREAARLISLSEDPGGAGGTLEARIINDVCGRMDLAPGTSIALARSGSVVDAVASAEVSVAAGGNTLTGFLDWAIPPSMTMSALVETRLQKEADWSGITATCP